MSQVINRLKEFTKEEQCILLLTRVSINKKKYEYIEQLLRDPLFNWDRFMGLIINHKVAGVVYKKLSNLTSKYSELLEKNYDASILRNRVHFEEIISVANEFENNRVKYAFLKGAILNHYYYSEGQRVSNDTDVFVSMNDLNKVDKVLRGLGFIQGKFENGRIIQATKKQCLFARMNTYEVIPYVKECSETPFFKYHELDINFKIKNGNTNVESEYLINNTCFLDSDVKIRTLTIEKFLIHLAIHLYREAVMVFKIVNGGDLSLYKFMDIHFFISKNSEKIDWNSLIRDAKNMKVEKDLFYALYFTDVLYPFTVDKSIIDMLTPKDTRYLDQYIGNEANNKIYNWNIPFEKRIFNNLRINEALQNIGSESKKMKKIFNELKEE